MGAEEKRKLLEETNRIIEQAKAAEALLEAELEPRKRKALMSQLSAQVSSLQLIAASTWIDQNLVSETAANHTENREVESEMVKQTPTKEECFANEFSDGA